MSSQGRALASISPRVDLDSYIPLANAPSFARLRPPNRLVRGQDRSYVVVLQGVLVKSNVMRIEEPKKLFR
jgi:hypothetical protein